VAILQYDFVDSYDLENIPEYIVDGERLDRDLRVSYGAVDFKLSFEEHRRRQVLASVLACCRDLGVEALVLPEYSAHPETVNWLAQHCDQNNYRMSIWAGTFRQQPGFAVAVMKDRYHPVALDASKIDINPMEAHLSVIFRETQPGGAISFSEGNITDEAPIFMQRLAETVHHRPKKYPSIGMGEEFKPSYLPLHPIMIKSRSIQRLESYVSELICSELFIFNGPLNWCSFADHLADCSSRYKVDKNREFWLTKIIEDAEIIAKVFSGSGVQKPRRSLLFVSCSTTRDADYHYFAQSAYLASGIVTAFCNGSGAQVTGGSCFVGQGGWETRGNGAPIPNPYHGVTPGILSNGPHRGALGSSENALIVADIRPERTVEDKPRSQAQGAPMRLVAHIPIIEDRSSSSIKNLWDRAWYRPRRATWVDPDSGRMTLTAPEQHPQILHDAAAEQQIDLEAFIQRMLGVVEKVTNVSGSTLDLDASNRDRVIAAAISLSGLFANSPGMRARATALATKYQALPERLPCPSLLDWMIVDLKVEDFEQHLRALRDLARKKPALVVDHSELTPALRDAPWRWVARKPESD
jgi:hypothetical protein